MSAAVMTSPKKIIKVWAVIKISDHHSKDKPPSHDGTSGITRILIYAPTCIANGALLNPAFGVKIFSRLILARFATLF
ncbi:hypothetical protein [Moraxella lacunata]|uniref:hypothetical protein n=1 Tax=Moraxella lacunata TaxID=477 RepID=UPI003EE04AC4